MNLAMWAGLSVEVYEGLVLLDLGEQISGPGTHAESGVSPPLVLQQAAGGMKTASGRVVCLALQGKYSIR